MSVQGKDRPDANLTSSVNRFGVHPKDVRGPGKILRQQGVSFRQCSLAAGGEWREGAGGRALGGGKVMGQELRETGGLRASPCSDSLTQLP